jgi:hypothetical protein
MATLTVGKYSPVPIGLEAGRAQWRSGCCREEKIPSHSRFIYRLALSLAKTNSSYLDICLAKLRVNPSDSQS